MNSTFKSIVRSLPRLANVSKHCASWRLLIILSLILPLWLLAPQPANAQGVGDYYQVRYDPAVFSATHVHKNKTFSATVNGNVTCTNDLPLAVTSGRFKYHIIARNLATNQTVTLLNSKTITVTPFPDDAGESASFRIQSSLKFPSRIAYGNYSVIAVLDKAEIMIQRHWIAVTSHLPGTITMGTIQYVP
jgi:hypothetical protein